MPQGQSRILVFGATGEIGSRIARGCVDEGHRVTGVSRGKNNRHRVSLDGVDLMTGDKGNIKFLEQLTRRINFDVVIDSVPSIEHVKLVFEHFNGKIGHYFLCSSTGTFVPLLYFPADEKHPWREKTYCNFYTQSQRDAHTLDL